MLLPSLLVYLKPVGSGQWGRAGRDYFDKLCNHALQLKRGMEINGDGGNFSRFREASNIVEEKF